MTNLFDLDQLNKETTLNTNTCLTCEHRQRWEYGSKVIQYCGVRKSNRTNNGLLKIKCKDVACPLYETIKKVEP